MKMNVVGKVNKGQHAGWFVKVEPDLGGYYVFFCSITDFESREGKGYDHWYPTLEDAERCINGLDVEWLE